MRRGGDGWALLDMLREPVRRRLGFAPVAAVARRWLPAAPAAVAADDDRGLVVRLLGPVVVRVDGQRVDDRAERLLGTS